VRLLVLVAEGQVVVARVQDAVECRPSPLQHGAPWPSSGAAGWGILHVQGRFLVRRGLLLKLLTFYSLSLVG
jgi:hypothetical protein